jgi:hypothetical protein
MWTLLPRLALAVTAVIALSTWFFLMQAVEVDAPVQVVALAAAATTRPPRAAPPPTQAPTRAPAPPTAPVNTAAPAAMADAGEEDDEEEEGRADNDNDDGQGLSARETLATMAPARYRVAVHVVVQCCEVLPPWAALRRAYERVPEARRPLLDVRVHYHSKQCEADRRRVLPPAEWAAVLGMTPLALCLRPLWAEPTARRQALLGGEVGPIAAAEDTDAVAGGAPPTLVLLLEDVADVAPDAFRWLDRAARTYLLRPHHDSDGAIAPEVMGVSLYGPRYNEVLDMRFAAPASGPYLLQFPPGWGAAYTATAWARFLAWCALPANALAPVARGMYVSDAHTNRWPVETSWRKWLVRFLAETGAVVVYPPAPASYVLPSGEARIPGHPRNANEPTDRAAVFRPSLAPAAAAAAATADDDNEHDADGTAMAALPVLDVYHRAVRAPVTAAALRQDVEAAEGCTLVMAVYSRLDTLPDRLRHLDGAPTTLQLILLVWNNMEVEPPSAASLAAAYRTPMVVKRPARNSMNNRLLPHPEIRTDCVLLMDDDWDMPYDVLDQVARTWHGHLFHRLVGVLGRNFRYNASVPFPVMPAAANRAGVANVVHGPYTYVPQGSHAPTIALPSGLAVHRRYLAAYAALPPALLQVVDDVVNCDDLLLNILVANLTGGASALTHAASVEPKADISNKGMFSRPTHFSTRSWCLNVFARAFPDRRLPLQCTRAANRRFLTADSLFVPPALADVPSFPCDQPVV